MVELTIQHNWGKWIVCNIHGGRVLGDDYVSIPCDTSEEAWAIFEALNGKPLLEIESFIKARKRLEV